MKEFKTKIRDFESPLWGLHILIPDEISTFFLEKYSNRLVCSLNDVVTFQGALMSDGNGSYFINTNKENRKKVNAKVGDEVNVKLTPDESKYGLPMPEELQELLNQDIEGDQVFHSLTPGRIRSLLHIIGKPKGSDTRLKKAIVVIEYLKTNNGKLDYTERNQAFKDYSF